MMMQRSGAAELLRARVAYAMHDLPAAESALSVAERLLRGCGAGHLLSESLLAQARVAEQRGDKQQAARLCREVLAQESEDSPTLRAADAHLTLATLDETGSDAHLQGATEIAYAVGSSPLHLAISLVRARRHLSKANTSSAIEVLRRAERLAGSLEHDESGAQTRVLRSSPLQETRDLLIDLLVDQGSHQSLIDAWACASAAKASSVRHLARPAAQWRPEDDDGTSDVAIGPWPISPEELDQMVASSPDIGHLPPPGVSAPVVPEGPLLEYHVLERDIIAFVVREGQVYVRRLRDTVEPSRRAVQAWQQHCALRGLGPLADRFVASDQGAEARAALAELRSLLIEPLEDLRDGEGEEWLVVAHRHLHEVPFEAILALEHHEGWTDAAQPTLAFGFSSRPEEQGVAIEVPEAMRPPLVLSVPDEAAPLIQNEAEVVAAMLPTAELLTHEAATRERLLDDSTGRSLVHVVCHGVYRSRNPFYSALRLSDGWVTARDLLQADLRGTLLVLSACDAGASSANDHGPIGLAWAGLAAGARGVVAAMWPVEDASTSQLMVQFYANLLTTHSVRQALARARTTLASENPDPHGWGAFRYFSATTRHQAAPVTVGHAQATRLAPSAGPNVLAFPSP
ncbi:CHAT domain-containing protein, partial [Nocardioides massiliensis]